MPDFWDIVENIDNERKRTQGIVDKTEINQQLSNKRDEKGRIYESVNRRRNEIQRTHEELCRRKRLHIK